MSVFRLSFIFATIFLLPLSLRAADFTINSGETKTLAGLGTSATDFGSLQVLSGGTLTLANGNTGSTADSITISGTGNGTLTESTTPLGAIYSPVLSGQMSQAQGIFASVIVDGSAAVTNYAVGNMPRLRFQGNVTGGELTTYATQDDGQGAAEIHAAMTSTFNLSKMTVAKGNFTFCGTSNGSTVASHTHYFSDGITVLSGAVLRSWSETCLNLFTSEAQTSLAAITLKSGANYRSENASNRIFANFVLESGTANFTCASSCDVGSSDASKPNTCISGSGKLNLGGSALLTLHDANTYSGGTVIGADSKLRLRNETAAGTGTVELNSTGTLELLAPSANMTFQLGGLKGSGNVQVSSESTNDLNLQVGSANTDETFSGTLQDSASHKLSLEKVGTGTLELLGAIASTKQLNLSAGAIRLTDATSGVTGGIATKADATTRLILDGFQITSGTWAIRNGSTLEIGAKGLTQTGGSFYVRKTTFAVSEGVSEATANFSLIPSDAGANVTLAPGAGQTLNLQTSIADHESALSLLTKTGAGTAVLNQAQTYSGATTITAGTLKLTENASMNSDSAITIASGATLELNCEKTYGNPISLAGNGANSAGALNFTNSATLSGTLTLTSAATLAVAPSKTAILSGTVSGSQPLTKTGAGTLVLAGSVSAPLLVDAGNLTLDANGRLVLDGTFSGSTASLSGTLIAEKGKNLLITDGTITFEEGMKLELPTSYRPDENIDLFSVSGSAVTNAATFNWAAALTDPQTAAIWNFSYDAATGIMNASINPNAIPEPAAWLLLLIGLLGGGTVLRKRRV